MRWRYLTPVIALILPLLLTPAVAADTGQAQDHLGLNLATASWTPTNYFAQTFTTPNKLERLNSVEVFVDDSTNGGSIEAWLTAGAPGTTGIAGTDVTANVDVGASHIGILLTPPTSITLMANSQYSIVFNVQEPRGRTSNTMISEYCNAGGYSGGAAYMYDGSNWATPATSATPCAQDIKFQVFMSPLPGTLDQHQNAHDTWVSSGSAQTFVAGSAGTLDAVSLWSDTDSSGDVTVELCSVSDSIDCLVVAPGIAHPDFDAGVLASATVTAPSADQWIDFVFSSPPTIAAAEYAIVIVDGHWGGSVADTYGNGMAEFSDGGPWAPDPGSVSDLAFQTFITPAAATPTPTSGAATAPPTSTAGPVQGSGSPDRTPLILALMVAIPVAVIGLAKHKVVVARRCS